MKSMAWMLIAVCLVGCMEANGGSGGGGAGRSHANGRGAAAVSVAASELIATEDEHSASSTEALAHASDSQGDEGPARGDSVDPGTANQVTDEGNEAPSAPVAQDEPLKMPTVDNRPVVYVYYDKQRPCPPCNRLKVAIKAGEMPDIRFEIGTESEQRIGISGYPTLHWRKADGTGAKVTGFVDSKSFLATWKNTQKAVEYQLNRSGESLVPRGFQRVAHTNLDSSWLELPRIAVSLESKSLELLDSKVIRLNRWFSLGFETGQITHAENDVVFHNPPAIRFHAIDGREGIAVDSVERVEFANGGAVFHLRRCGAVHFKG
jgi:hypothetical protein